MCKVLGVKRSGYYYWLNKGVSKRQKENELLVVEIDKIHRKSRGRYGSPKITIELGKMGYKASRQRVARLMKKAGIRSKISKKFKTTTDSKHSLGFSPHLLDRQFQTNRLGKVWVSDITYIRTALGWLYLTVILDLADRKVIGWALSQGMTAEETTIAAWKMALKNRPVEPGLMFHSDRGVQYAAIAFRRQLGQNLVIQSMSRKANCWDNAVAESFFKILKAELAYDIFFPSEDSARIAIFEFIEIWYNRQRIHQAIGYRTPLQMEQLLTINFNRKAA